jgi:hypothetical protein
VEELSIKISRLEKYIQNLHHDDVFKPNQLRFSVIDNCGITPQP